MSAQALANHWIAPARRRAWTDAALLGAAPVLAIAAVGLRLGGPLVAVAALVLSTCVVALLARRRALRYDSGWLIRELDATRPDMEDSSALLFTSSPATSPLQHLQRARIAARLDDGSPDSLVPPWSRRAIIGLWAAALILGTGALLWPRAGDAPPPLVASDEGLPTQPGIPRLVRQNLRIIPPAYTGLPARDSATLDARVPVGSRLEWTFTIDPAPAGPRITILDAPPLSLRPDEGTWIAGRFADKSFLYRVDPAAGRGKTPPLHRIDAMPDLPPQVTAVGPGLALVKPGQQVWSPTFAASDDYGVEATARLRITLAIGEGENVRFSEREIAVSGTGPVRERRFAPRLDFSRFGFVAGSDMVVQLIVRDNRRPQPQEVRGPSLILRWPSAQQPESGGLQGMVNTTLPAYFRSQRQIIMDAEALLKRKRALSADAFSSRSAAIGADQQILRGRYSQFLGGDEEGEPEALPSGTQEEHSDGDGHDHGGPPKEASAGFGAPEDVLAQFGHPHDESPASSLDPETRAILKKAVDEMWQSERELRQGQPGTALPFAYRALRFIKEVQQATRIFLSRVGPELPPIDPARRMTGKREGIGDRVLEVSPAERLDAPAAAAWRALNGAAGREVDLEALDRWARTNAARLPDPLALGGAIDALRRDPQCTPCRVRLRSQIWTAMARPTGQPTRRPRPGSSGARYLRAIEGGAP